MVLGACGDGSLGSTARMLESYSDWLAMLLNMGIVS
jgi:hypothetical protein